MSEEHPDTSDWKLVRQFGLEVNGKVRAYPALADAIRDFRQYMINNGPKPTIVTRQVLASDWQAYEPVVNPAGSGPGDLPDRPRQRRYTKEPATKPVTQPPKKVIKTVKVERDEDDPSITKILFADPGEQLRYEVDHWYLFTVPVVQRVQWTLGDYEFGPRFLDDVREQSRQISRSQIVAAIVDVVSGRHANVPARQTRALREGGGDHSRAQVTRDDGALAFRANVNTGTPAARRIMWWRLPEGTLELARLATHDDVEIS